MSTLLAPAATSAASTLVIGAAAFLFGLLAGWQLRARRTQSVVDGAVPLPFAMKRVTVKSIDLTLKCTCGNVCTFHDGFGQGKPGSVPLPAEDSYACPACGKLHDLKELRRAARQAGAAL